MSEVNKSLVHELGHVCMGVLEDIHIKRIECDPNAEAFTTHFIKKHIRKHIDEYSTIKLYLAGPAADSLIFGRYEEWMCIMDEEKAYGILLKRKLSIPDEQHIDPTLIIQELFDECYMRLTPFYKEFLELEPIYRYHKIIEGEDLQEVLTTFRRRMNGLPTRYGSERTRNNHSTITALC